MRKKLPYVHPLATNPVHRNALTILASNGDQRGIDTSEASVFYERRRGVGKALQR